MTTRITDARLAQLREQYGRRECLVGEPHIELDQVAAALTELIERRAAPRVAERASMSGHTKGSWHVSEILDDGRLGIVSEFNEIVVGCARNLKRDDARLIAAAPDMYEYIASSASNGCAEATRIMTVIAGETP